MIANSDFLHMATYLFDNARAFMPQYYRQRHRIKLIARDYISMAHAHRYDASAYFIGPRIILHQIFNLKRPILLANNCCLDFSH
jgi:hypothetical protein